MPGYRRLPACLRRSALSTQLSCSWCRGSVAHWRYARLCVRSPLSLHRFRYNANERPSRRSWVLRAVRSPQLCWTAATTSPWAVSPTSIWRCCTARDRLAIREIAGCVGWTPINPSAPSRLPAEPITAADAVCATPSSATGSPSGTDRCQGEPAGETDRAEVRAPARHGWTRDRNGRERALRGRLLFP